MTMSPRAREAHQRLFGTDTPALAATDPDFTSFVANFALDEVPSHGSVEERLRWICICGCLAAQLEATGPQHPSSTREWTEPIPWHAPDHPADVWLYALHGGAGTSTLTALLERSGVVGQECTSWPFRSDVA